MIVVITTLEKNPKTGRQEHIASHGIDLDTGQNVVLPNVPVQELGAWRHDDMNEYVLTPSQAEAKQ